MTLAANALVSEFVDQQLREFPVAAAVHIYNGALVGLHAATGYLKPHEPGDVFIGIAYEESDNSSGAAAATNCKVYTKGDFSLTLTSAAITDNGKAVFATADDTLSLTGHPDSYVGRIVHYLESNTVVVRIDRPSDKPLPSDEGCVELLYEFGQSISPTGAVAGPVYSKGFQLDSALGLGVLNLAGANGGVELEFDAVNEIAQASISTPIDFAITKGITFEADLNVTDHGDSTELDIDWGIGNVIDGTTLANMDDDTLTKHCRFHLDGNADVIYAESDSNAVDVAAVDTTIANVEAAGSTKNFKIIARVGGTCELYIDNVRVLSSTTFAVSATGAFAGFVNIEKTAAGANTTTATVTIRRLRVAGARA